MHLRIHKNRQDGAPPPIPTTVAGLSDGAATVGTEAATKTDLAFDTSAHGATVGATTPPGMSPTASLKVPATTAPTQQRPTSAANTTNPIPISTVIAVCLCVLVAVVILVVVAMWLYRRTGKRVHKARSPKTPLYAARTARGELELSRARQERWSRLQDDKDDKWETRFSVQTGQISHGTLPPMEKLTTFKTSLHSSDKSESSYQSHVLSGPLAVHNPRMVEEFGQPLSRNVMGRTEPREPMSWDSGTFGDDSVVPSVRSKEFSPSGAVSAFPTPQATAHVHSHRWESAEVMHFGDEGGRGDDSSTMRTSFSDGTPRRERRKSTNNPFFGGSPDKGRVLPRSRSASRTRSRSSSNASNANPFADPEMPMPQLPSDRYQTDRAMQSLIAALDSPPQQRPGELRVSSIPSMAASTSEEGDDRVESYSAFPLPPHELPPSPVIR